MEAGGNNAKNNRSQAANLVSAIFPEDKLRVSGYYFAPLSGVLIPGKFYEIYRESEVVENKHDRVLSKYPVS